MGLIRTIDQKLTAEIADSAITTAKVADGAISEAKVADGAIAQAKIADGAVNNAKVASDAAIAHTKLGTGMVKATVIAGGAAGDHTVTGISTSDSLVAVLYDDLADAGESLTDITSEFSITAADTINNAGGTDTTGGALIVVYEDRSA